ncbi:MAG: pyrroline-5-carboxylate reductase family protein [Planctomycetota bacterium]|jgi:pyrroline-5-carboxylate reductase
MSNSAGLTILGAGNIGTALARGLARAERYRPEEIVLTRRHLDHLETLKSEGFSVGNDNQSAVASAEIVVLAVQPQQLDALLDEIAPALVPERHVLISVVSGASSESILARHGKSVPVVRAMPNVAIAIGQSMTCLSAGLGGDASRRDHALDAARWVFDAVGTTLVIDESHMVPATALCACGIAFFLRVIRAASQGGIEIGFHPEEALASTPRRRSPWRPRRRSAPPRSCSIRAATPSARSTP